jgi:hypothetical protein
VAHGFGDGQISGELANAKPDIIGKGKSGHALSYGYICRKKGPKIKASCGCPILLT